MKFIHMCGQLLYKKTRGLVLGSVLLTQFFSPCNALSSGLLIIYPNVKMPYQKIYSDIIKGIDDAYPGEIQQLEITKQDGRALISKHIDQYQPDVLVTLGKHPLKEARLLTPSVPIIAGALTKAEPPVPGISMTPDPEILLARLFLLAPSVKHIYVITDVSHRVQTARAEAYLTRQGKTLYTKTVASVQQAADEYLQVINRASADEAIWIMRGTILNEPSILRLVLEAAWKKKIVVFSSSPSHVKRGALFSVYPDNEKMGRALAEVAKQQEQHPNSANQDLTPLRNLLLIVNKRTSKHLGISSNTIRNLDIHRVL